MHQHRLTRREVIAMGLTLLAPWPRAARAKPVPRWIDQRQMGPFVVRATFSMTEKETTGVGLSALEAELRRVLSVRPCRETINVLLLGSREEHRACVAAHHPTAPYRRALFVKQGSVATVYAYRNDELAIDLRHECTHALLHADLPMVPLWLDEGLAEYFEPPEAERPLGPSHLRALRRDLRLGRVLGVAELEKKHDLSELGGEDYRFSWGWTHFMLHGPKQATEALWGFLARVRRQEPPGDLSRLLAMGVPHLEERFITHFREWPKMLQARG